MRRQVKPFVTEYRGNARRSKDSLPSGDMQQDSAAPRSRSYAAAEKVFHNETPDDSYEAALRAADALFNLSPGEAARSAFGTAPETAPEPRGVASSSPPSRETSVDVAKEIFSDADVFASAGASVERDAAVPPRRILQALEPATDDRFAALEAERAPKRRGRKPGSKNKPKFVAGDDWSTARPALAIVPALPAAPPVAFSPTPTPVLVEKEQDEAVEVAVDDMVLPQPRGRTDKFGWKRAGLRPGERWKRRLPKAAW